MVGFLSPTKGFLLLGFLSMVYFYDFFAPYVNVLTYLLTCLQFHQNWMRIATVREVTDRQTEGQTHRRGWIYNLSRLCYSNGTENYTYEKRTDNILRRRMEQEKVYITKSNGPRTQPQETQFSEVNKNRNFLSRVDPRTRIIFLFVRLVS